MPVFDAEGDGLYPTKFHVLSYVDDNGQIVSITDQKNMSEWLVRQTILIGHNIELWDVPHLERVLGISISARLIDTLALCWYLFPNERKPGLEYWGEYFHVPKPPIDDWENLSLKEYVNRCETDVKINSLLWDKQEKYLVQLYDGDLYGGILDYLSFKLSCAREQERSKWRLNKPLCESNLKKLQALADEKEIELKGVMPKVAKYGDKKRPLKCFNKDGNWSVLGAKWFNFLTEQGLPHTRMEPVEVLTHYEEPKPTSPDQVKEWLYSLGWEPDVFKEVKEDDGSIRQIPQIKKLNDPELSNSVIALIEGSPEVGVLENFSIINHRIGLLEGFLKNVDEEGFLKARIQGLTNTLRFKHTEIVNLPGVDKLYGREVRECLIARNGYELAGTDMVALEDNTKRHYMYPYDPKYVEEMSSPDFDAHLDVAQNAGYISAEQVQAHKEKREDYGKLRKQFKVVNYSGIYGVGAAKLSRELKTSIEKAKELLKAYWKRNWSVKQIAKDQEVKTYQGQMWLLNPVSGFWYSLRYEKDIFSTLNQGTATYCFDCFVKEVRARRSQLTAQFHDEIVQEVKIGYRDMVKKHLQEAIDKVNNKLKLNVTLQIDTKFGDDYASIH